MADNERVEYNLTDKEDFLQDAPVKANRTNFTPGIVDGKALDQNWPVEFPVKVGNTFIDTYGVTHNRVVKLGRNSVCDVEFQGIPVTGTDFDKEIFENERSTGYDTVKL